MFQYLPRSWLAPVHRLLRKVRWAAHVFLILAASQEPTRDDRGQSRQDSRIATHINMRASLNTDCQTLTNLLASEVADFEVWVVAPGSGAGAVAAAAIGVANETFPSCIIAGSTKA